MRVFSERIVVEYDTAAEQKTDELYKTEMGYTVLARGLSHETELRYSIFYKGDSFCGTGEVNFNTEGRADD